MAGISIVMNGLILVACRAFRPRNTFGSSLWQLYKSIDSPYKSVLKAILLEAYSWEYPHTQLLSVDGKRRFFCGSTALSSVWMRIT